MSSIVKNIIIVLVIAGLGFFAYNYLKKGDESSAILKQDTTSTSKMGAEVLAALNQLKSLKLDAGVFSDDTFLSLKDFSKPIDPEPIGRVNPFSPIGVEVGAVKLTSGSSTVATSTNRVNQNGIIQGSDN